MRDAPAAASSSATASPMPLEAPVMRAVRPAMEAEVGIIVGG